MLAAKHLDVVLGIDIHIVVLLVEGAPVPTPMPHPFVGWVFDPHDYVPPDGAKVFVNGWPRAHAGSAVVGFPHIPMGGPFLKQPANAGELYMGSSTVQVEGEPMTYAALPVLTCSDLGMPAPLRAGKRNAVKSALLPTSIVIPIPAFPFVMVGGSPTISMPASLIGRLTRAAKMVKKATELAGPLAHLLKRARKAGGPHLQRVAGKVFDKLKVDKNSAARNAVSRAICTVTGHPVDVASGKLFTDCVDLTLQGPLPFALERVWYSTSTYDGPLGHGWHASFDAALVEDDEVVGVRLPDGRVALFPALECGETQFHQGERLTLQRDSHGYRLCDARAGLTRSFAPVTGHAVLPLVQLQDRSGRTIQLRYDDRARLHQLVDSAKRVWDLRYQPASQRIAELLGPDPATDGARITYAQYSYDARGNLVHVRDALGHAQRFSYDRHLLVQETNRNGLSFYFEYDAKDHNARCTRTWGDGGIYDHKLHYDLARKLTTVTNSRGFKTQYQHDGALVTRTLDAFGNVRETRYGKGHQLLQERDELGQQSTLSYDQRGNLTVFTGPDGTSLQLSYDDDDLPVHAVDAVGGTWSWTRDQRGRVLKQTNPLGHTTHYEYQGAALVGVVEPSGARTTLAYAATGELVAIAAPNGALSRLLYDRLGRPVASVDPQGNLTRWELDLLGKPLRVHEPDGNARTLAYDPEGNLLRETDHQHDVRFTYQGLNRLASRSQARTAVHFHYDTEEQLTAITNQHGSVYRFVRGATGQVDAEHGFDALVRTYTRDKAGRVVRVDRPGERFSAYGYDAAGRVIEVSHHDGASEHYTHRADGALASASNDDATVTFERDALGRVTKESQGQHWVESRYDPSGRRIHVRSSLGAAQAIERDTVGDVQRVHELASGFDTTFTRDLLGRELARSLPGGARSTWTRDPTGRPSQHVIGGAAQPLYAVGYKWDINARLCSMLDGLHGPSAYHHDALGRLASASYPDGSTEQRTPDAVGNLFRSEQRTDRKYGPAGQLLVSYTHQGSTHYRYDLEGNLLEKRTPDGRLWRYQWNAAGRLAKVTRPDGSSVSFAYDALARRIAKTYRGQTTRWVWDGNVPLHEWVEGDLIPLAEAHGTARSTDDAVANKRDAELQALLAQGPPQRGSAQQPITWLFEPDTFTPIARICADQALSIVSDHLGTPVLMVDAQATPVWAASLRIYGQRANHKGDPFACPFRWPGQHEDAETGLHYNRFRYYDPDSGQYLSQDPLGLAGGPALYAYTHDPLTWIDPLGLSACSPKRTGFINPAEVRFTQDSVKRSYRNGTDINDAIESLRRGGHEAAASYPPIRIVQKHGQLYTLDNRRLLVFSQSSQQIPYRMATPVETRREFARKFSTGEDQGWGQYISVRP